MTIVSSITENLHNRLLKVAETNHLTDSTRKLERLAQNIDKVGIILTGAFGRGKTTTLNALIGSSLLPMKTSPLDTYTINLQVGTPPFIIGRYTAGDTQTLSVDLGGIQQVFQSRRKLESVKVMLDTSFIQRGQNLVEVPGIGETNPAHADLAKTALVTARFLLFVIDAVLDPIKEELDFLENLPPTIQKIFIIANKIDLLDNPNEAVQRWMNRISSLRMTTPIEYFKISAQQALAGNVIGDWTNLVDQIANIPSYEISASSDSQDEILNIALAMREQLLLASPQISTREMSRQEQENLAETKQLILNVIRDQNTDIKQTIKENLEATVYKLENDLRNHNQLEQTVASNLQLWANRERERTQKRLERHVESVLDDVEHTTGKSFDLKVTVQPITVGNITPIMDAASVSTDPYTRRLQAIGAGTMATAASFFFTGWTLGGWVISIGIGTATAVTTWVITERGMSRSKRSVELPDLQSTLLPAFYDAIDDTTNSLGTIVKDAFEFALGPVKITKVVNPTTHPSIIEIDSIIKILKNESRHS